MTRTLVQRDAGEALYRQIARAVEQEVRRFFRPGDVLPPERVWCERFGVNRHTFRHAVDGLVDAGLVDRRHGRGMVVLEPPVEYGIGAGTRFTETLEAQGRTADTRVLGRQVVPASGGVARRLELADGAAVLWVETLRTVDAKPFCLISHFLPQAVVGEALDGYADGSLHELIKHNLNIGLRRSYSLVSAALPMGDDAPLLKMPAKHPLLRVKSLNVDAATGGPVEYALTRFRADAVQLSINP
ncbi:MAG TPA: phosphonate metabolism transcriptional regulator PhnF [Tepidisphaeraceae bacterium]|nr:phosphonate metabolism transcriptional regulator PhnF [Tepidisphaeraceae bacterium]